MGAAADRRRRNFRAARLRQKLRLRRSFLDGAQRDNVSFSQCDLLDNEHAAADSAGHPSPEAQEKAPPETGADFSDERPTDDEGCDDDDDEHEHAST